MCSLCFSFLFFASSSFVVVIASFSLLPCRFRWCSAFILSFSLLFLFRDVALLRSRLVWGYQMQREPHSSIVHCWSSWLPRSLPTACISVSCSSSSSSFIQSASTKVPLWSCVSSTHTCIRPPDELHRLFFLHSFLALFLIWFLYVLTCLLASYYDHD